MDIAERYGVSRTTLYKRVGVEVEPPSALGVMLPHVQAVAERETERTTLLRAKSSQGAVLII